MLVLEDSQEFWVVVTEGHRRDLSVNVEKDVAVDVDQIIAKRLVIIGKQLDRTRLLEG